MAAIVVIICFGEACFRMNIGVGQKRPVLCSTYDVIVLSTSDYFSRSKGGGGKQGPKNAVILKIAPLNRGKGGRKEAENSVHP